MTQQPWPSQWPSQPAQPQPTPGWGAPPPPAVQAPQGDPFETTEKMPSVSFDKDANGNRLNPPVTYELKVVKGAELVQQRDIDTGRPLFWTDEYGRPTDPRWTVVIVCELPNGERRGLWANKWDKEGSLFRAIADAQRAAGARIAPGGKLTVQWYGTEPPTNPKFSPRKLYRAKYEPDVFPVGQDPFGAPPDFAQGGHLPPGTTHIQRSPQEEAAAQAVAAANTAAVAGPPPASQPQWAPGAGPGQAAYPPPPAPPQPGPFTQQAQPTAPPVQQAPTDPWANEPPPF